MKGYSNDIVLELIEAYTFMEYKMFATCLLN